MASSCEIRLRTQDDSLAKALIDQAYEEGRRIERHFSRYRDDNPLYEINAGQGSPVKLDHEYRLLFEYALTLYDISDGMFDISSGVLRRLWTFDNKTHMDLTGIDQQPVEERLATLLPLIGLDKVEWQPPLLRMRPGMELDFGGIGKEYAVDRVAQLVEKRFDGGYLINFGGDCYCRGDVDSPWSVAVDPADPERPPSYANAVTLATGGVATSGTTRRYFRFQGRRFGHILNPKTGWPVHDAPMSVTVVNQNCLSAGAIATLGMLRGKAAEAFLTDQDLVHWVMR